ncbi:MAG: hypothetical protein J6K14_06225 [Clostridia bacterium]|nr:hypothetical protein [Clostridia bacterium]
MRNAGRSLFMSVIALLLCFSMLLGLTWAWFTDSATSDRNTIEAGNLDVELEYRKDGGAWKTVDENTNVFKNAKWEPGYTEVVYLRVTNAGTLALKYLLSVKILEETASINVNGVAFRLSDFIKIGGVDDVQTPYASRSEAKTAATGVKGLREGYTKVDRLAKNEADYVALVLYIPESVGNEANAKKGEATPKIDLGLRLVATQVDEEGDSFGSDFDKEVGFPALRLPGSITESVSTDADGKLANDVVIKDADETIVAEVPEDVQLTEQAGELSFSVSEMESSGANITLADKEILRSLDVHIEGVATTNTVPIRITIKQAMMPGLNLGNFTLYHVEGGIRVAMTRVASLAELDAHNEFVYDPATGDVILSMATFSEVAIVADTENAWNGSVATDFAGGDGTEENPYLIANADQLAYFGKVVGGMGGYTRDSFDGKFVKLVADINLGYGVENHDYTIFHPIGYYFTLDKNEDGVEDDVYSTIYSFEGTFDGNGNTIANFYQNTWEIKGDYNNGYPAGSNHYSDGFGLFGYVVDGTVKNLTVDNFSSDGEFTPTGVIAAYAENASFENIAITNCNPRVYNTGNGGIVGVGGNSADTSEKKMTFTNITVDNSNKISALWGSWDVACGGLMGMFRGYSEVKFTNCHVAAQIDVYNDVCGNYQYYWYRYAGMVIGSLRGRNTTDAQGYTVPDMTGITAEGCTVHFGDWNDYYYCELVANSLASYTHDHQFSRLTVIDSLSEIKSGEAWTKTGNFLLAGECYHIVSKDGALVRHLHEDAGEETVNGKTVLKEDKQVVYLPFNQLFQGDGWGVKHVPVYNGEEYAFDGITILDREIANSLDKFEVVLEDTSIETETTLTLGEIFAATGIADINKNNLKVFVSPIGNESTVSAVYVPNGSDWTQGTLTFDGIGAAKIVITDYTYCKEAVAALTVTDHPAVDKFAAKDDLTFYHTLEGDTISTTLGDIFTPVDGVSINSANVVVTIDNGEYTKDASDWTKSTLTFVDNGIAVITITDEDYCNIATATVKIADPAEQDLFEIKFPNVNDYLYRVGNGNAIALSSLFGATLPTGATATVAFNAVSRNVTGAYTANAAWDAGTIKFTGTGVAQITIDSNAFTTAKTLTVEVVEATNLTSAKGTITGENFVLLCDISTSGYVNYWNCTLYGNGFTYSLNGAPTTYNKSNGHGIIITQNATLDNLVIVGDVYKGFGAYKDNDYYNTAIDVQGPTVIQNCYIANCAAPIKTRADATIIDTTLYGGTVANLIIQSGTVTLENVTTANFDDGRDLVGLGIVVHSDATETAKLVLNGTLTQYNFISEANAPTDTYAKALYDAMFGSSCSMYHFGTEPNRYVNAGIVSMTPNFDGSSITDNVNTGYEGQSVTINNIKGFVYTQLNTVGTVNNAYSEENDPHKSGVQGDYLPTPEFSLGDQAVSGEDRYLKGDINGVEVRYMQGETPIRLDITNLMKVYKYAGVDYTVTAVCKDVNGNIVVTNGVITFNATGSYTLIFTVEDNEFYAPDGAKVEKSVTRTYEVPLSVVVAEPTIKDAVITVDKTAIDGGYNESFGDRSYKFNPLDAITITDAEGTVNLTTNIASTNIVYASSSSAFAGTTTITVTYNDGRILTIVLGKPSLNAPGSSKEITYANDGTIKSSAKVASKSATGGTWTVTSYSFKGTNGKTISNNTGVTFTFPDKSCVTGDTLVMLADGTQKRIDQVSYEDQLLVWNFFTGTYDAVSSAIIFYHGDANYDVLNLKFSDGTVVKVINNHGFYDVEQDQFVFITADNVAEFIGHHFTKVDGMNTVAVELIGYEMTEEYTGCYSIQSAMHNNFMVEGMFSLTIPHYEGWFDYFEIGEGMKYDEAKMQADIEKYGLYAYEDFAQYVTYEQFIAFNGPYLKVLVGRGVVTYEQIIDLIGTYVNP